MPRRNRQEDRLARYRRLRARQTKLHSAVFETVPRAQILSAGRLLGCLAEGKVCLETDSQIDLFMDFVIYCLRSQGHTPVERYATKMLEDTGSLGTDEKVLLEAMRQAKYGIFEVARTGDQGKMVVRDRLDGSKELELQDINLSRTAGPGLLFGCNLIPFDDCWITTGAFVPCSDLTCEREVSTARIRGKDAFGPTERSDMAARVIRASMEDGHAETVGYRKVGRK